ncbi:TetR family transcriptional regulator [Micromonospora pisi]|uniref:TetR family transcriptional regulator n=1 Tax=Micromonospora pisi TaxID=589240 RepID=A0A495JQ52_9ACTN|nr:TetR/AcrR family transcriptional regulator [Micromonospora pisi]RKR91106.1 TetR family transcriptional regulator [Micromonospora pisi]
MRADAVRNLDAVLHTGARLLADDPATSIATIAAQAGVDRRTVYRRFPTRDALLSAVYVAKLDASEKVLDEARLTEAPVVVALHRYVESIIPVSRQWPLHLRRLIRQDPEAAERADAQTGRLRDFLARAVDEGLIRADLPDGWALATLGRLVDNAAHDFADLAPGRAADVVVSTFLDGVGKR